MRPALYTIGFALTIGFLPINAAFAQDTKIADCPKPVAPPKYDRSEVYKTSPFKAGEMATYEVSWSGLKAGEAILEVRRPTMHKGLWHRVFHMEAKTGDWFKAIFVGKDETEALSRPWDFGISRFYMDQDEGKMFGSRFQQKKWLEFDHDKCKVTEKIVEPEKPERNSTFDLMPGANDALGVVFNLRTKNIKLNQKERILVYTSEKNWWLEALPVAFESITVPAGTFKTAKLKLQTFIGKEMQQQGDVWAWIDVESPSRVLVQIQGEIRIGSVWIRLNKFKPGAN